MKTTKDETRALKNKHRLELVMQEAGEIFDGNSTTGELWLSASTPGLTVDTRRQIYEIKFPGKDESGDVIAWLKCRYSWTFSMAVKFLQKRPADPKRQDLPTAARAAKKSRAARNIEDETKPIDHLQEEALQIGGDRIREYFSWSHWDLVLYNLREEIRIDPTFAPQITQCQRCDKRFDWLSALEKNLMQIPVQHGYKLQHVGPIPIVAYSIKRYIETSDLELPGIVEALGTAFVEDENGVVCVECAVKEIKFQVALSLCERSARAREQAEEKEQRKEIRDAWQDAELQREREQTRMIDEWEAARDSAAGEERTELL